MMKRMKNRATWKKKILKNINIALKGLMIPCLGVKILAGLRQGMKTSLRGTRA